MSYQNQYKCNTEEAITHFIELKKNKEIIFRNRKWASIKTCCEFYDLNEDSVKTDMWNRKCTPQEAIERAIEWKKAHEITYHGVKYPSLPQCCEDLGINPISIRLYMEKNGVSSTRAITHYIKSKEKRAFEFCGINESSIRSRAWRKKCTWEEAVKYYIQKKETETPKMQFFYKGKKYKSVSACCAEYGVNASSVRNRAKTTECSIEESLEHFIKKARMETQPSVFIFRDKTYSSLEECCLEYGVNADSVSSRKYRLNCTIERRNGQYLPADIDRLYMLRKKTQPEANNDKILISVKEACELTGLSEKTMRSLMNENCFMVRIGRRTLIDKKKFQKWIDWQS